MQAPAHASTDYFSDFPSALRYWRDKRGLSQLQLSAVGTASQRHLSFLESGRSQPSKELILKLGIALDIPLRQRNVMLLSAGFAPAYKERGLADPELAAVRSALDFMLKQQAPYPALVVDRLWNLQMANAPAAGMIKWLMNAPDEYVIPGDGAINVLRMVLDQGAAPVRRQLGRQGCGPAVLDSARSDERRAGQRSEHAVGRTGGAVRHGRRRAGAQPGAAGAAIPAAHATQGRRGAQSVQRHCNAGHTARRDVA